MSDAVPRLLERLGSVPAYVVNARYDIVAWNAVAGVLFPDLALLPPGRRNVLRMWMDPDGAACGTPAGEERGPIRQAAADLREAAARYPSDPELHQLIDELSAHDPTFAADWARHDVRATPTVRKRVEHGDLGALELDRQTLHVPGHDHRVVLHTAEPGSPDRDKLDRLEAGRPQRA